MKTPQIPEFRRTSSNSEVKQGLIYEFSFETQKQT